MPGAVQVSEWEAFVGRWRAASARPDIDLAGIVVELWELEGRLAPFREKVLPNGCVEVMIDLGPPHYTISEGERTRWERAWYSGLHERSIEIQSEEGTHLVSARLSPLGALALFGLAAPQAANRIVDLEAFASSNAATLRAELLDVDSPEARFALLERFLRGRSAHATLTSSFVAAAVARIDQAHGNLRVSLLHEELGVSRKHLTVSFTREVGLAPKSYARMRRFVRALSLIQESEVVDWAQLAVSTGYADQSHLVRDFRRVADAPPTEFLRKRSPDGTALIDVAR